MSEDRIERILKVRDLMREREIARNEKNYTLSDEIRNKLNKLDVEIIDQKNGPSGWKFTDGTSKKLPPSLKNMNRNRIMSKEQHNEIAAGKRKRNIEDVDGEVSNHQTEQIVNKKKTKSSSVILSEQTKIQDMIRTVSGRGENSKTIQGVQIIDNVVGNGRKSKLGDRLKINYVGKLKSTNKIFDSSSKKPFTFRLGRGSIVYYFS
jgi:FKBP-type peptidyl-prolyl cis-trans isomerase